jgi:16S rRNA (cytosine1402-N4)-methyltransferase
MLKETIDLLVTDKDGIYIDGTLGGGGHTEEILKRLKGKGKVLAFDVDEESVNHCRTKFWGELSKGDDSKLQIYNMSYREACSIEEVMGKVTGFLLDLGLSSRQLDDGCRGFSYRMNSNLDMRFGSQGVSAAEILHAAREEEIEKILHNYGEEPFARVIARQIVQQRRAHPIITTFELRNLIESTVPPHLKFQSLSRVFQALRIAVNKELENLSETLNNCLPIMAPGGRFAIISYHSLEDRIVKIFFKEHSIPKSKRNFVLDNNSTKIMPYIKLITPKPLLPSESEIKSNPRARSAKLRVAEVSFI